jgi:bifunctional UDP-N-acetylglucosamine pyrophosphorylase/glucosamine-1-phosphate N-acetyltransferase
MGTAHALSCVNLKESFVMVNGDVMFDSPSLGAMIEKHKSTGAAATLGAYRVDDVTPYGALAVEGKKVIKILEKSKKKESGLANAGVYVFSPQIFEAVARTKHSPRGELEVTASIQKLIDQGRFVQFHELKWWQHVGVPWDLLDANEHFLKMQAANVKGIIEDGAHVASNVSVGDGTRIRAGAYIEGPSRMGKNCDIGPNCFIRLFTSLGDRVRIGNGVEVKNSIIMDETHIGHLSYIGDSIVGGRCNFGAGTKVGNLRLDEKNVQVMVRGKLVDTGRRKFGAIIADDVKTGLNSVINPGISLGPNSALGPGVVLYKDLPPNKCILIEQQLKETSCR